MTLNKNSVEILSPDSTVVKIVPFMEQFFLSKGFSKLKKTFYYNLFTRRKIKILRKIKLFFKIIFNTSFYFSNPKKSEVVLLDCVLVDHTKKIIGKKSYEIIPTRLNKLKKLYLNYRVIKFIILNLHKRSLKQNYILAVMVEVSPKIVITHIDNSIDFQISAKFFEKTDIKFFAIQYANRDGQLDPFENKKINNIEYFGFSNYDKKNLLSVNFSMKNFNSIGSLKASLVKEYIKDNKITINPKKYDICLLSEPVPFVGDFYYVENFFEIKGKIAEYTHRICENKKLKLIFSGKHTNDLYIEAENSFYANFLKNYKFNILKNTNNSFSTFLHVLESKIVIGHNSTILREAISLGKKVLACNLTNHKDMIFPVDGLCTLNNESYTQFEKKVLNLLDLSDEDFFLSLGDKKDYIINTEINAANYLRSRINKI